MKAITIKVSGKVQGVFFRKHTVETALLLGVAGYVMNQTDGTVFIHAEGSQHLLEELVTWCYQGSPRSRVDAVEVKDASAEGHLHFAIR